MEPYVQKNFPKRDSTICLQPHITTTLTVDDISDLNGSLILSLERTLFSALNNAYLIVFVGIGLMMVGSNHDTMPDTLGNQKSFILCKKIHNWAVKS
jgi:hypothetical protein